MALQLHSASMNKEPPLTTGTSKQKAQPDVVNDSDDVEPTQPNDRECMTLTTTSGIGDVSVSWVLGPHQQNIAQFNPRTSLWSLNATFISDKPFTFDKLEIKSGDHKGYQALLLTPALKHKFDFLEISGEIRNMIYDHLLAPEEHEIRVDGAGKRTFKAMLLPIGHIKKKKSRAFTSASAILAVCKQMNAEASPILYGRSPIRAYGFAALFWFLHLIGKGRQYIRHVIIHPGRAKITNSLRGNDSGAAFMLMRARSLGRLQIRVEATATEDALTFYRSIADKLWWVIAKLKNDGMDLNGILGFLELIIEPDRCSAHSDLALVDLRVIGCGRCRDINRDAGTIRTAFADKVDEILRNAHGEWVGYVFNTENQGT